MSNRGQALSLALLVVLSALFLPCAAARAAPEYFVDFARTVSGDGSAASPWKRRSDINWAAIKTALQSGPVTVYFSSRSTWNDAEYLTIASNTNATGNRLTLDGQSRYNTAPSGLAVWETEAVGGNRAVLGSGANSGGTIYVQNDNGFITIRGFSLPHPTWGGVGLGTTNPTVNIHDILVENNVIDTPTNNHGVWLGYGEAGCYNITVRGNTISNTPLEAIYMGHYNYLADTLTGTVVEYNTVINAGTSGEGDIDIKPPNFGAIVRYNKVYSVSSGGVLAGIVVGASDVQVYGNELYSLKPRDIGDGGNAIQINADGDGAGHGKRVNNVLVYNNLIYANAQNGIALYATLPSSSIANIKILNNTIVSNGKSGFKAAASGGGTIAIAKFENNILTGNFPYNVELSSAVTVGSFDYNCHYGTGALFRYQGAEKSWLQWRALGFDAHGLNADPRLNNSYAPSAGSPIIGAGTVESEFGSDRNGVVRGAEWEIGAYEFTGGDTLAPAPPARLRWQ